MTTLAATALRDDTFVWPTLENLRDCLCLELVDSGGPGTCMCEVFPGAVVPMDYVSEDGDLAWVRLVSAYPSMQFPTADTTPRSCVAPYAFQIEVGVARCTPTMHEDGTGPSADEQWASARLQMSDMAAMSRAIKCCLERMPKDVILGTYAPGGPAGGVVWGTWNIYVRQAS